MNFKKWVKSIQAAAYNGARTVYNLLFFIHYLFKTKKNHSLKIGPNFWGLVSTLSSLISVQHNLILFEKIFPPTCIFTYTNEKRSHTQCAETRCYLKKKVRQQTLQFQKIQHQKSNFYCRNYINQHKSAYSEIFLKFFCCFLFIFFHLSGFFQNLKFLKHFK